MKWHNLSKNYYAKKKAIQFFIQLDESTLPGNEALLLAYVRFVKDEKICQELLFAKNSVTNTKRESIYKTLEEFKKKRNSYV